MSALDAALLAAHAQANKHDLVVLYEKAANQANSDHERRFFLTHAYIFALDIGSENAGVLRQGLVELGAETGQSA